MSDQLANITENRGNVAPTSGNVAPINLDISLIPLVHEYLQGATLAQCALDFNISEVQVSEFLNRREVKQYISNQLKNSGYAAKQRRIELLSDIVDEKREFAKENDMPTSSKDILEVLRALRDEENDLHKLAGDMEQDSGKAQYIQIINSLKAD